MTDIVRVETQKVTVRRVRRGREKSAVSPFTGGRVDVFGRPNLWTPVIIENWVNELVKPRRDDR